MHGKTRKTEAVVAAWLLLTAGGGLRAADAPPNPEKRKPEVVANWKQLADKVKADIEAYEPYLYRKLNVYWTDKPPVLDAKLDDRCWADAEVAGDFIREDSLVAALKPTDFPTEVRVCYDAANLYVAYRLYDRAMDTMAPGQPQDYRDILEPHGNAIELFLDPTPGDDRTRRNQDDNRLFQLGANPRGATYDARGYGGLEWNPDWTVKTAVLKDCWIVEAAIPFRCLNFPPEPTATPQVGEVWGALFCRDHGMPQEWSRWTSSAVGPLAGFHNLRSFGRLVFQGRKDGNALPVVKADRAARLDFGHNQWSFALEGNVDRGAFTLTRQGKVVTQLKLKPGTAVQVPFAIADGGELQATVLFSRKGAEVYRFDVEAKLPPALAELDTIRRDTAALSRQLAAIPPAVAANLTAQCRAFAAEAVRLKEIFDSGKVDAAALEAFAKLHSGWRTFGFDAGRIGFYPPDGKTVLFGAAVVDAYTKIFPRQVPAAAARQPEARLAAAGNDRESFQLLVVPFWTDLEALEIAVQPLTDGTATIAAANVEYRRLEYAQHDLQYRKILPGYDPADAESKRDWPDVLLPVSGSTVNAPADRMTVLWFDVLCPAGTAAGTYRGAVTLSAKGHTVSIPVTLTAAGFDLPRHSTLRHNSWLAYHYPRVFHGAEYARKLNNFSEFLKIYENDLRLLDKYRMGQFPFGPDCWSWIKTTLEPDGRYTFDFSELAAVFRLGRQYGANWFTASFGCNPGGVIPIANGSLAVTERATGKTLSLRECPNMKALYDSKSGYLAGKPGDAFGPVYATPLYRDFLPRFTAFLKDNGLLEYSYFEQYDEAKPAVYLPGHRELRRLAPDMPLMNEGPLPADESLGLRGIGYNDRWEPGLNAFDNPNVVNVLQERRRKYGETYGYYVCATMERADNRCTPYIKISQPTTAPRILGWFAWKHDINHMLIFMQFAGMPKKGWTPDQPPVSEFPGYSPLTYPGPGPEFSLIPTLRLATLRDGFEDYEYFKLLHGQTAYLDDQFPPHRALLERIKAELVIEPAIIVSSDEWTDDAGKLQAKRARVVKLIQETNAAIAAYPEAVTGKTK